MSHYTHHLIHDFLKEKEFNQIYLSVFIMTFAESLIEIFIPIYLFQLGYSISMIIFFYFLVSLFFVIFALFGANVVSKIGVKHSILISVPFLIVYYIALRYILFSNLIFFVLPALLALRMIFYNFGFHLNYIEHSNNKKRGKELSTIGILMTLSAAIAPILAGIIILRFGFNVLFLFGAILLFIGTIPLFFTNDSYEKINISTKNTIQYICNKKNLPCALSFFGYAIESVIDKIIWPIFLIILLLTVEKVGIIISISIMSSIIVFNFAGKLTDKYNKKKLLKIGTFLYFFGWIGRLFANSQFRVLVIDSYKNISAKILRVPWTAKSYDIATKEEYFNFIVVREVIFNLSRIIVLPIIIMLFYIDFFPFITTFLIAAISTLLYPLLSK